MVAEKGKEGSLRRGAQTWLTLGWVWGGGVRQVFQVQRPAAVRGGRKRGVFREHKLRISYRWGTVGSRTSKEKAKQGEAR